MQSFQVSLLLKVTKCCLGDYEFTLVRMCVRHISSDQATMCKYLCLVGKVSGDVCCVQELGKSLVIRQQICREDQFKVKAKERMYKSVLNLYYWSICICLVTTIIPNRQPLAMCLVPVVYLCLVY